MIGLGTCRAQDCQRSHRQLHGGFDASLAACMHKCIHPDHDVELMYTILWLPGQMHAGANEDRLTFTSLGATTSVSF